MQTQKLKSKKFAGRIASFMQILLMAVSTYAVAEDFRVGVVDTERILRESTHAVKAEKKNRKGICPS